MSECKERRLRPTAEYCAEASAFRATLGLNPIKPEDFNECRGCLYWGTQSVDSLCYDCTRKEEDE